MLPPPELLLVQTADITGIIAILMIFGPGFYAIKRSFDLRERKLHGGAPEKKARELVGLRTENKLLRERIENLESIVCSVDYELNCKIQQVLESNSQMMGALSVGEGQASSEAAAQLKAISGGSVAIHTTPSEPEATPPGQNVVTPPAAGRVDVSSSTALDSGTPRVRPQPRSAAQGFEPGELIEGRYRIERLLGQGGMGAVYLSQDEVLNEPVALKVISPGWSEDPVEMASRFRHEASAARKISSPQVIRIHDLGETRGGLLFISMEYFPGETLQAVLQKRGPLGSKDRENILGQVCDGLIAAHDAGVVHRDLKPQNVLVGARDTVKLIDFGLAKSTYQQGMTATGMILGTPEYMSPEQIKGLSVDARSDIYSLGALTYHALTGKLPFSGKSPIAIGFAHLSEEPKPPRAWRRDIPLDLEKMILAALAKEPDRRPQSVDEFRKAL